MKKFCLLIGLFMLGVLARPGQATAQSATRVVVTATAAPVLVQPDPAMIPLRMAKEGSVLNVIASEAAWYRIEFQDPQLGRRVGYIEKRHVSVVALPVQQPIDVTVPESSPAQNGSQTQQRLVSQTVSQPSAEIASAPPARRRWRSPLTTRQTRRILRHEVAVGDGWM